MSLAFPTADRVARRARREIARPWPDLHARESAVVARSRLVLAGLLLLTFGLRAAALDRPLLGHFATKGAVYGMIARNLAEGRAGFFEPTLDLLSLDSGERTLHMLELPLPAYATAGLWRLFGGSLDAWGRASALAWSLAGVALMFAWVRRRHSETAAVGAALTLACSPVGIIFGQTFQLEASLVALSLAALLALERYLDAGRVRWLLAAGLAAALLFVTKIFMVVLLVPLLGIAWKRRGLTLGLWLVGAASLVPAILWYGYVFLAVRGQFGFPVERLYFSVRDSVNTNGFPHPLLGSAWFYGKILKDLCGPVLTPVGCGLFVLGLFVGRRAWGDSSDRRIHLAWLLAVAALVLALPRKFHELTYYWVGMLPVFCTLAGLGLEWLAERATRWPKPRWIAAVVFLAWLAMSVRLAWRPAFVTPDEDAGVVAAAEQVQRLSLPESRILTVHGTTLSLLYQCNRAGWTWGISVHGSPVDPQAFPRELEFYRRRGAEWLVVADGPLLATTGWQSAARSLEIAASGEGYAIYRLNPAPCFPSEGTATLGGRRSGWARATLVGPVLRERSNDQVQNGDPHARDGNGDVVVGRPLRSH